MPPDEDAPYTVDTDPTTKVSDLRMALLADPALAVDKLLACMDSLEMLHQRQESVERLVAGHIAECGMNHQHLDVRFKQLLDAINVRRDG
jgi:hypothetical protein